jgi:hypothetical protein
MKLDDTALAAAKAKIVNPEYPDLPKFVADYLSALPMPEPVAWQGMDGEIPDGVYLCWVDAPPQSFKVQGVRRKNGRWLTSWPVVAWAPYPAAPKGENQ